MLGGELLGRSLGAFGVQVAFGVQGGHLDAFLLGCVREGIELVDTRHEATGVHAADGYARFSGKLGLAFATAASGYSNAMAGLANAYADRSPVLLVTSSAPMRDAETNPLQGGIDQVAWARPVSKWAHQVTTVEEIPRLLSVAVRTAVAGAPGPVVLDVPIDVMFTPVDPDHVAWGGGAGLAHPPAPAPAAIDQMCTLLDRARRPILISGGGTGVAPDEIARFAERWQVPVFNPSFDFGAVPAEHPCNGWGTNRLGGLDPDERPDLVVLLGVRPGAFLGGRSGRIVPPEADVVHVDTDAAEIGRLLPVEVGITSTIPLLLEALEDRKPHAVDRSAWVRRATGLHRAPSEFDDAEPDVEGRMHPYHAIRALLQALPGGAAIIIDGGETCGWVARTLHHARPARAVGNGGQLGMLGMTPGLAIGAWYADRTRPVVMITGDGGFGFHLQELDTFVRHGIPVLVVVVNNAAWQQSADGQREIFGEDGVIISSLADTEYHVVAQDLGAGGRRVDVVPEVEGAVEEALASGVPWCLNLSTSVEVVEPGTPAKVGMTDDPDYIVIPYYENVPR